MKVVARKNIKVGKIVIPKNTEGYIVAVSNSDKIKEFYQGTEDKLDSWYFIVTFPQIDKCLVDRKQVEIIN